MHGAEYDCVADNIVSLDLCRSQLDVYVIRSPTYAGVYEDGRQVSLLQPPRARADGVHLGQRRVPHAGRQRHLACLHHRKREGRFAIEALF